MSEKVLLVDDSKEARSQIKKALGDIFTDFIEAVEGIGALKSFVEEKPCLVITDIEMPSIDGYRFISTIRSMEDGRDVPIIILTGSKDSLKKKLRGFDLGASDFLVKPFHPEELTARVKSLLRMSALMNQLKERNAQLKKLAITDELTGLYNRRCFFDKIKEQMALGHRHNFKVACILIDIDHFKKINDTNGHQAGDEVLKKIGRLLKSCKREGELIARFGGEEFVLCLFNTSSESAYLAAERFRNLLGAYDFSSPLCPDLRLTVSIGVAVYPHNGLFTIDDLLKAADKALYRSKRDGRNRVTIFEWAESASSPGDGPECNTTRQ